MNLPSVKTLKEITSYPKELRQVLECNSTTELYKILDSNKPFGPKSQFTRFQEIQLFYTPPSLNTLKLEMADQLCETCGVESISAGHNSNSPAFRYCNAGDAYATTLLYISGRYRVGCYGDVVERGNYD